MSIARRLVVLGCAVPLLGGIALPGYATTTDSKIHVPALYDSFEPPALGSSYLDPAYGTVIKRSSDAVNTPSGVGPGELLFVSTEYSTASAFNSDNSRLILQHQSYFGLYDGNGNYLRDLPLDVNAATEPRWSRTDPNALYYVTGNDLVKLDVASATSSLVHSFSEYSAIRGRGESDISRDGDHFVLAGDEPAGLANRYVFVYEISTDTKGPVLDTIGHGYNNLYIAPDNSVAIGWLPTGTARFTGVELFNPDMTFRRQLTHALGHQHLTRDTNGDDVLVWNNSNDPAPPISCANGIVKVRLSDSHQSCLLRLDWSLAVHVSAPDGNGWAFVETYAPGDPLPGSAGWKPYTNELLQVKLDGTETRRLLHHRSRPVNGYGYQPRATVSRDGSKLVFTSNYDLHAILGYSTDYSDAYFVSVFPPVPTFEFDAANYSANEGKGFATITVRRIDGKEAGPSVDYFTSDGTATGAAGASRDYTPTATPQTLTFPAKKTSQTFQVPVTADARDEGNETVLLRLSNPQPAAQGVALAAQSTAVLTITDDDSGGQLQFSSASYSVSEGAGSVTLSVQRIGGAASGVTVAYDVTPGSALDGSDYASATATPAGGVVTFASTGDGAKTQTIRIPILQDALAEGAESFSVRLSSPTGGAVLGSPIQAAVAIQDDEATVEFSALAYSAKESPDGALITVKRSGATTTDATVSYATGGGSATANLDYKPVAGTLTFAKNATSRTFLVPILKDSLVEGPETLGLTLSSPVGIVLGAKASASLTIVDDDPAPTLQWSAASYTVNEATPKATLVVNRTGSKDAIVTVDYAVTGGTATGGSDYDLASSGTLTFVKGVATLLVPIVNDLLDEGTETLTLELQNPQNLGDPGPGHAVLGPLSATTLLIADNETTVQFSGAAFSMSEKKGKSLTISVKRTGSLAGTTTVRYDVATPDPGTATRDTGSGGDYKLNNVASSLAGTLSFLPDQSIRTFTVDLNADTVAEGFETIRLALSAPTAATLGTPSTATVTLEDDDVAGNVQFSAANYSVAENAGTAAITVTRAGGTSSGATVLLTATSGSSAHAAASADFDSIANMALVFGPNEKTKTVTISVHDDGIPDAGGVSVDLILDTPANGLALGPIPAATLWIVRN